MAQPKKPYKKHSPANTRKPQVNTKPTSTPLFVSLDNWLNKRSSGILIAAFSLCILFSLLLFQVRMDIGGDDSGYILRAYDFIHKGVFPNYQGPLYPIFLSIFMSVFGIKIILFKVFSVIFNFFALFFLYKTFKDRIPPLVLFSVLLLTATNSYILSFASLTYSEACFMFLQSLVFFYFFKLVDKLNSLETITLKDTYKDFLLAALFVFLLSLSRSVGLFAFPIFILFFIVRREFRNAAYYFGAFAAIEIVVGLIKRFIFHASTQWGAERSVLMLKNQYDPSKGTETISGFGSRFIGNTNLYLSKRFFQVIGLRSPDTLDVSKGLAFLFIALSLFALYRAYKSKNQYVLTITFYCGVMLACTFLAVQTAIDQPRLIMVYVPFLLLMFLYAIYDALKKATWVVQSLLLYPIIILIIAGGVSLIKRTGENIPVLDKNIHGDLYYGFTPDWANYIKLSQWCADSLPKNAVVATRKSEISFIYTNKEMFFPVYKSYSTNADSVLEYFKEHNVNYVILASLRANPKVADENNIVTTLWRMMQPIARKYPRKIRLIHEEGTAEPAFLYEVLQ